MRWPSWSCRGSRTAKAHNDNSSRQPSTGHSSHILIRDWSKFQFAGHLLGLADGLENPIGQPGSSPNVVIDKQELAEQAAHGEPALVEVLNPLGVDERRPEQLHYGLHQLCLAVVAAAKQDRYDGECACAVG